MAKNPLWRKHTDEDDNGAKSKVGKAIYEGTRRAKREATKAGARPPLSTVPEERKVYTPRPYHEGQRGGDLQAEYKEFRDAKANAVKKAKKK